MITNTIREVMERLRKFAGIENPVFFIKIFLTEVLANRNKIRTKTDIIQSPKRGRGVTVSGQKN
jgi:hypothetical protein